MAPTIRIDDEVWEWLKQHARPLEDTPNSVLRRIAGLPNGTSLGSEPAHHARSSDPEEQPMQTTPLGRRVTGEMLSQRYRLGALHALYHKDGMFFERLTKFPGALCDPRGFVLYRSGQEFERDPRLRIGQKVNVPGTLASHPNYRHFPEI